MYLRQCKQCQFLFRSEHKTKKCDDCKAINKENMRNKLKDLAEKRKTQKGYIFQHRLKAMKLTPEDKEKFIYK